MIKGPLAPLFYLQAGADTPTVSRRNTPILPKDWITPFPAKPIFNAPVRATSRRLWGAGGICSSSCRRQAHAKLLRLVSASFQAVAVQAPRVVIRGKFPDNYTHTIHRGGALSLIKRFFISKGLVCNRQPQILM